MARRHDDDEPQGEPRDDLDTVEAPLELDVIVACPRCGGTVTIYTKLSARVTLDSDGTGTLALRTKAAKAAHVCGQASLGLVTGGRSHG